MNIGVGKKFTGNAKSHFAVSVWTGRFFSTGTRVASIMFSQFVGVICGLG